MISDKCADWARNMEQYETNNCSNICEIFGYFKLFEQFLARLQVVIQTFLSSAIFSFKATKISRPSSVSVCINPATQPSLESRPPSSEAASRVAVQQNYDSSQN